MQLCQLLLGRLCCSILVPLRAFTQALCFIWTMNTSKQTTMRSLLSFILPVNEKMPAVITACLPRASACYLGDQCVCSILVGCCICMAAAMQQSIEALLKMHNTGMGTAYLSRCFVNVQDAPRSRIDKNEQDMWWPQAGNSASSHSPKRKASTTEWDQAVKGIEKMALHVNANIPHKDQLATFVPWQSIHFAAHLAGEMPGSACHVPTSSKMGLNCRAESKSLCAMKRLGATSCVSILGREEGVEGLIALYQTSRPNL